MILLNSFSTVNVIYKGETYRRESNDNYIKWFLLDDLLFLYENNKWCKVSNSEAKGFLEYIETPIIELKFIQTKRLESLCLYKLFISYSDGFIEGLFFASCDEIAKVIGKSLYFYKEEQRVIINLQHITKLEVSSNTIKDLFKHFKDGTISGYNIIDMINNQLSEFDN